MKISIIGFLGLLLLSSAPVKAAPAVGDQRLINAAKSGDLAAIRSLIKQNPDVNGAEGDGMTALHWAVYDDQSAVVALLLRAGANPNVTSRTGRTPLLLAAENGNPELVDRLIQRGADVNSGVSGETPLHVAAYAGDVAIAKLLVAHGADIDAREKWYSETPLMLAATQKHSEVVRYLIDAGADVNATAAISSLVNGPGSPNQTFTQSPRGGLTPLSFAARDGCVTCIQLLLAAGANVNFEDPAWITPLNLAVYNGHFDAAALLLERGASANDDSLFLAVDVRNLERDGRDGQVRPNPRTLNKVTSLDLIRLLLEKGADAKGGLTREIQSRMNNFERPSTITGLTALQRATAAADLEVMKLLLDRGADPNRLTMSPEARLDGPDWGGSLALLLAVGARGGRPLAYRQIGDKDPIEAVKLLLDRGADVNAANLAGMTSLHLAAQQGSNPLVQLLVARGARLTEKDYWDRTPLDAAGGGHEGLDGFSPPRPPRPATQALLKQLMTADAGSAKTAERQANSGNE